MSKPIESAEEFAAQTRLMMAAYVAPLISARDNAVRLALLDEVERTLAYHWWLEPDSQWPRLMRAMVAALRAEYGAK